MEALGATLLADVGVAIFRSGFDRWVDSPADADLAARIREAGAELTGAFAVSSPGDQQFNRVPATVRHGIAVGASGGQPPRSRRAGEPLRRPHSSVAIDGTIRDMPKQRRTSVTVTKRGNPRSGLALLHAQTRYAPLGTYWGHF